MSAPPRSEPHGMQPSDIPGKGTTTVISQGMAISWETTGLGRELMRIAVGSLISSLAPRNALLTDPAALYPPLDPAPGRHVTDGCPR